MCMRGCACVVGCDGFSKHIATAVYAMRVGVGMGWDGVGWGGVELGLGWGGVGWVVGWGGVGWDGV